ncbi:zinc finger, CCHC-type containing protein [Tanacetum coccineum]
MKRNKWDNDDYVCRGLILNGMSGPLFDIDQNVESFTELWDSLEAKYMAEDASSKKFLDCKGGKVGNKSNGSGTNGSVDGSTNSLKRQIMFNKSLQAYYVTYVYEAYFVQDNDVAWWVDSGAIMRHATPSLANKKYLMKFIDDASRFCYVYLLHTKDEALDKFKVFKIEVALQQGSLIKRFRTDRRGEYMDTLYFQFVGIIYEMTAPYTPQQNGISKRKNKVLKEMVNSTLSY